MPFPLLSRDFLGRSEEGKPRPRRAEGKARKRTRGETWDKQKRMDSERDRGEEGKKTEGERERERGMWDERKDELLSGHRCAGNISHVVIATESVYRAVL